MFKKIFLTIITLVILLTSITGINATHTLTVQSQGWIGSDCGSGTINVVKLSGKDESTTINPGETKIINLPDNTKKVEFHSNGRHDCYNANLNNIQETFTLSPNCNFYVDAWFYKKSGYYNGTVKNYSDKVRL
ncbi:MAG: hypothetical protein CfClM3_1113 [Methanobrevibacter sp. CfCl-M3]